MPQETDHERTKNGRHERKNLGVIRRNCFGLRRLDTAFFLLRNQSAWRERKKESGVEPALSKVWLRLTALWPRGTAEGISMNTGDSKIPPFREDGYLPEGLYQASEAEVTFRFGGSTRRRRKLALRLRRWIQLARLVGARRLLVDGSFVTAKANPNDIDAVMLIPADFEQQIEKGMDAALELEEMLLTRCPEEIFAAEDELDWKEWVEFFSRTREADGRRKGLVEIEL